MSVFRRYDPNRNSMGAAQLGIPAPTTPENGGATDWMQHGYDLCRWAMSDEVIRLRELNAQLREKIGGWEEDIIARDWPQAISNGLTLPCSECGVVPNFDYHVADAAWEFVAPKAHRRDVICLPCFDRLAHEKGIDVSLYLKEVQFTGIGKTVVLTPEWTHRYQK